MRQEALFDAPTVAGLRLREGFITADEQERLIAKLAATDLSSFRFHGWLGNRKTKTFGWRYDFDDSSFTPAEPIPQWLYPLRAKAADFAALAPGAFAGLTADDFVHVLLARYDPGAGIGWHRDRPQFEEVVGVSFGTPATMRFRRRTQDGFRRANVHLEPGSAYLLSGESRWDWEHSIVPGKALRFSITFRSLSERGRRLAESGQAER